MYTKSPFSLTFWPSQNMAKGRIMSRGIHIFDIIIYDIPSNFIMSAIEQLMEQILIKITVGYTCLLTAESLVLLFNFTVWPYIE